MKKNITKLIIFGFVIFILTSITIAYLTNNLLFLGLCKPGDKIVVGMLGKSCYTPSEFEGKPCDKETDCGQSGCALVDASKTTGKGICKDMQLGCNTWIDENGTVDFNNTVCID